MVHPQPVGTIPSLQRPFPAYRDHPHPTRMISIQTTIILPWFTTCCFCEKLDGRSNWLWIAILSARLLPPRTGQATSTCASQPSHAHQAMSELSSLVGVGRNPLLKPCLLILPQSLSYQLSPQASRDPLPGPQSQLCQTRSLQMLWLEFK